MPAPKKSSLPNIKTLQCEISRGVPLNLREVVEKLGYPITLNSQGRPNWGALGRPVKAITAILRAQGYIKTEVRQDDGKRRIMWAPASPSQLDRNQEVREELIRRVTDYGADRMGEELGISGSSVRSWRVRGIPPRRLKMVRILLDDEDTRQESVSKDRVPAFGSRTSRVPAIVVARLIRDRRKEFGRSQPKLARQMSLEHAPAECPTQTEISRIERGVGTVSWAKFNTLAQTLLWKGAEYDEVVDTIQREVELRDQDPDEYDKIYSIGSGGGNRRPLSPSKAREEDPFEENSDTEENSDGAAWDSRNLDFANTQEFSPPLTAETGTKALELSVDSVQGDLTELLSLLTSHGWVVRFS